MKQAGVVAALVAEARTLGPATRRGDGLLLTPNDILVAISGMGLTAAGLAAAALVEAGAGALVSWGLAGGLDPELPAGTVCLPLEVVAEAGTRFPTDPNWRSSVDAAIGGARRVVHGKLLSRPRPLDGIADKASAFRSSAASAVDMESLAVADVAARHGLPFIAVRVIVDTATDEVPPAVAAASTTGQLAIGRLLDGLLRAPQDIPAMWRLGLRYRTAIRSLQAVARSGALAPLAWSTTSAAASRIA